METNLFSKIYGSTTSAFDTVFSNELRIPHKVVCRDWWDLRETGHLGAAKEFCGSSITLENDIATASLDDDTVFGLDERISSVGACISNEFGKFKTFRHFFIYTKDTIFSCDLR